MLQAVGASRTPFAVYSGGHASNPGFSSTTGVHISLRRLNQVELSKDGKIATLGFGQVRGWRTGKTTDVLLTINLRSGLMSTKHYRLQMSMLRAADYLGREWEGLLLVGATLGWCGPIR